MIDLNLEEAHLWEVSPKELLHGGLLSGLRSEIQETEAPQWRRGRGGGDFCGGSVKLPKSSCEPGNQWKSPLKSELSEMFKTPRRRGSWWLLLAFSWHSKTYRLFIFFLEKFTSWYPHTTVLANDSIHFHSVSFLSESYAAYGSSCHMHFELPLAIASACCL
jgi:hypothetical protein